jgi:hypothetical protein
MIDACGTRVFSGAEAATLRIVCGKLSLICFVTG